MSYSMIGLLAIAILLIINHDVFFRRTDRRAIPAHKDYRTFLLGILAYYITDVLWGVLNELQLTLWLYADTLFYFLALAMSVMFWTQFVISYLEEKDSVGRILLYAGRIVMGFEFLAIVVNFYSPILYRIQDDGVYTAGIARHVTLCVHLLMFLLTGVYTLRHLAKSKYQARIRYMAIGAFGFLMAVFVTVQIFNPLYPMYALGYLLGSCLLYTFVIEDEKEEARRELEASLRREQQQRAELGSARRLAYTDALTGVKSKLAYVEKEEQMDLRIAGGEVKAFAVAVFDLNGLKHVNDTLGHEYGDQYIISACRLICNFFKHSPVYRVGGDEFVAILEGSDYENRAALLTSFNQKMDENFRNGLVVVSAGMAEFSSARDNSFHPVFDRADQQMYHRKDELKKIAV